VEVHHHIQVQDFKSSCNLLLQRLTVLPTKQSSTMPLMRRTHRTTAAPRTTRTTRSTARPSLKTRLLGGGRRTRATTTRRAPATTTTTTTTKTVRTTGGHHGHATAAPVHHHKRHATMGDKVSGALMKLRGSLTRRPGLKVCCNEQTSVVSI
jgi:hypothetical protein